MKWVLYFILSLSAYIVFGCSDSVDEVDSALTPIRIVCGDIETTRGMAYNSKVSLQDNCEIAFFAIWYKDSTIYIPKTELKYKDNCWTDGQIYYWPLDTIKLISYAPASSSCITNLDTKKRTIDFSVSSTVSEQVDLMCSNQRSSEDVDKKTGTDIKFAYRHVLSRIDVCVNNKTSVELTNVSVGISGKFCTQGVKRVDSYGSWESRVTPTEVVSYAPDLTATTIEGGGSVQNADDNSIFVIPTPDKKAVDITVTLHYTDAGTVKTQSSMVSVKLEQGNLYTLTLNVNAIADANSDEVDDGSSAPATRSVAPLEVTTCVEPWE